jgi:hypothetical protein
MGMDYNGFKRIIVDESRFSGSINIHNWDLSMEDVASGNFTPFLLEIMLNSNSIGKITGTFPGFNCCVAVLGQRCGMAPNSQHGVASSIQEFQQTEILMQRWL